MKILISSHKLEDIELICDRAVFLRDGHFVQDVNMAEGQSTAQTIIQVDPDDFEQALYYLTDHFKVVQSQKESGEIILNVQSDYRNFLKGLAQKVFSHNILKHVKYHYATLISILINEVVNHEYIAIVQIRHREYFKKVRLLI